jgi:hypothetical protein
MAEKSVFGVEAKTLSQLGFDGAIERIQNDLKTDFIIAPHLSCVYTDCQQELVGEVTGALRSGSFTPNLPIVIDVPKKQRVRAKGPRRQFANYSRPGGILHPSDRLVLQTLADVAQDIIERHLDRSICFSHQAAGNDSAARMFKASRECWTDMQAELQKLIAAQPAAVVLRADVAACFQSINQHTLVNNLEYLGYPNTLVKPLESMLTQASTSRSSRGVLQGIYPSDLFGNFYLYPIDRLLKERGIPGVRYVDDVVAFFPTGEECDRFIVDLTAELRKLDLSLNEAKTVVTNTIGLLTSDPDLETLFKSALNEAQELLSQGAFEVQSDYGFQAIWENEDIEVEQPDDVDEEEIQVIAIQKLFDQSAAYPDSVEEIERFCLPLFAEFESTYPLQHVLSKLETTPSMSQMYYSYLSHFLYLPQVQEKVASVLRQRRSLYEWEYLWALASLTRMPKISDEVIGSVLQLAKEVRTEAVRAMCFIVAARHGDVDRQKTVADAGQNYSSEYMRGAILFGARFMQRAIRKNVLDVYGNQTPLLKMIAASTKARASN